MIADRQEIDALLDRIMRFPADTAADLLGELFYATAQDLPEQQRRIAREHICDRINAAIARARPTFH
jgi:hypothetical protein